MIKAEIIADSINPKGNRITSWVLEYPRFVHSEILTHRVFSKNAASSRAIPTEKIIQAIIDNPAMPVWWGKNQSGMQAKEELDDTKGYVHNFTPTRYSKGKCWETQKECAKGLWLEARDQAVEYAKRLLELGLHKQIANRILEPWFHMRIILTGTEFSNFFALRAHPDAQPEFQELAYKMLELYNTSTPKSLQPREWHIPFGDKIEINRLIEDLDVALLGCDVSKITDARCKIAIARCARISFLNFEGKDDYKADIKLCDRLFGSTPRHLSPTEHVAQCLDSSEKIGNFIGWKQYRYTFNDQNLNDSRVIKK